MYSLRGVACSSTVTKGLAPVQTVGTRAAPRTRYRVGHVVWGTHATCSFPTRLTTMLLSQIPAHSSHGDERQLSDSRIPTDDKRGAN